MKKLTILTLATSFVFVTPVHAITGASEPVASFNGTEHIGLPEVMLVGAKGQVKRPDKHYLAKTKYSFVINTTDDALIKFADDASWTALAPGKVKVAFSVADPNKNKLFQEELKDLKLSPNWGILEVYVEPDTVTILPNASKTYRIYNPNSGEHFYTTNKDEYTSLVKLGWKDEGIGWQTDDQGSFVYRVYNPNAGDHHYTTSKEEVMILKSHGWIDEGGVFIAGGKTPVYRVYNPNATGAGSHHYTTNKEEADNLIALGWKDEGIGWYAK